MSAETNAIPADSGSSFRKPRALQNLEQLGAALQIYAALAAVCLIGLALLWRLIFPAAEEVGTMIAGLAALVVAGPILTSAWRSLRHPTLHGVTDQLVALAFVASWATGDLLTAAILPVVIVAGHMLEERSLAGSQEAIRRLRELTRGRALRRRSDGVCEDVDSDDLRPGDVVEVRAGDRLPADGVVEAGRASLDTASVTGEPTPIEVEPGSSVFGGSINLNGSIAVTVVKVGRESTLGRIAALVSSAARSKPSVARLLEKFASEYLGFVLLAAGVTWFVSGSSQAMLAVLVAACPCALVLAAPSTAIAGVAVAARHGILIKGAAFLEDLASVTSIVFDKTGTVTAGELHVVEVLPADGVAASQVKDLAAALGAKSSHPVSRAVAGIGDGEASIGLSDVREWQGQGVTASAADGPLALGRPALLTAQGIAVPLAPEHDGPIVAVASRGRFLGWILLDDRVRDEAKEAVIALRQLGLKHQLLLTGDRPAAAARVAHAVGIEQVRADALPEDKLACVVAEIAHGRRPLVVGDGINDALALKAGAVGMAMGAKGSDIALAAADIVLMSSDLRRVATCVRLSRRCRSTIVVNVAIGLGWAVLVVAAASCGLLGNHGAIVAALLHNVSTLLVMANAGRLLHFDERE